MGFSHRREKGVALLLALFALVLISAVGVAIVFMSSGEGSITANERSYTTSWEAARAGLEEARARAANTDSHSIANTNIATGGCSTGCTGKASLPTDVNTVLYIINPADSNDFGIAGNKAPWTLPTPGHPNPYFDYEYDTEWCPGVGPTTPCPTGTGKHLTDTSLTKYSVLSDLQDLASTQCPAGSGIPCIPSPTSLKWVRITVKTEQSAQEDVDQDGGTVDHLGGFDNTMPIFFDAQSGRQNWQSTAPSPNTIVYRLTAFVLLPNGTSRMAQYDLKPGSVLNIPGALTIDGPIGGPCPGANCAKTICGSGSTCNAGGAFITGNNPTAANPPNIPSTCTGPNVPAIATADATSASNLAKGITNNASNITGTGSNPSIANASTALASLNSVTGVENLVSEMEALANGNVGSDCSTLNLGSQATPTITVVTNATGPACNLNSGATGYGILVVTGTLNYVNVNSYEGIILMLGTAQFVSSSSKDTTFTGALLMAQYLDPNNPKKVLSTLGSPTFNFHHGSASSTDPSIQFNQCVINQVEGGFPYQVLSAREINN